MTDRPLAREMFRALFFPAPAVTSSAWRSRQDSQRPQLRHPPISPGTGLRQVLAVTPLQRCETAARDTMNAEGRPRRLWDGANCVVGTSGDVLARPGRQVRRILSSRRSRPDRLLLMAALGPVRPTVATVSAQILPIPTEVPAILGRDSQIAMISECTKPTFPLGSGERK